MVTISTKTTTWHYIANIALRFWLVYFLIYILPFPLDLFSGDNILINSYRQVWGTLVTFTGKDILHIVVGPRGSDTLFHYTRIFTIFIIAVFVSLLWTALDKKKNYSNIFYWLTVYVRYYLAYNMIDYGFSKFFNVQFTPLFPDLDQLLQPYGDFSPQGLLWKFMGYSKSYQAFTGVGELIGGLLLLFRPTITLGALIITVVMSNVVMMNISYDVPVKIYSSHLLLMAIFLLVIDARRIIYFFILNRTVYPVHRHQRFRDPRLNKLSILLKSCMIIYLVYLPWNLYAGFNKRWFSDPKPALYGIYKVEKFISYSDTTAIIADSLRWKHLIVNLPGRWVNIQMIDDSVKRYNFSPDTVTKTLIISSLVDSSNKSLLSYSQPKKETLTLRGKWKEDSVHIQLKRVDIKSFRLVKWRHHWIYKEPTNF